MKDMEPPHGPWVAHTPGRIPEKALDLRVVVKLRCGEIVVQRSSHLSWEMLDAPHREIVAWAPIEDAPRLLIDGAESRPADPNAAMMARDEARPVASVREDARQDYAERTHIAERTERERVFEIATATRDYAGEQLLKKYDFSRFRP